MTISKRTIQLAAAGATLGLFFILGLIAGGISFFLPAQKSYGLTLVVVCLPMLIGLGAAVAAYFVAGRMIKDDAESSTASASLSGDESEGSAIPKRSRIISERGLRRLLLGLIALGVIGFNVISIANLGGRGWGLLVVQVLVAVGGAGLYLLVGRIRSEENWMDETGWPVISGLCVLVMAAFFVIFVGGPALGQFIGDWFVQRQPATSAAAMKILGNLIGGSAWAAIAGLTCYLTVSRNPSKGVIIVTVSLPILTLVAFFGFELIEWAVANLWAGMAFAKSWILYAIFSAILTAIFVDQTKLWEAGVSLPIPLTLFFIVTSVISWAVLSAVGATYGMYGQGAVIVAVALSYGIYLSWERSNMSGGGEQ